MDRPASAQADRLMLDAKKAILQEQHQRFQDYQREERWDEAWKQLHVTLTCAADLLKDSVGLLEKAVNAKNQLPRPSSTPPDPPQPLG
ncbi:MAG: hypothetical protein OEZ57_04865 [Nitrospirota bacterium]|nr:hypothetical protein [Nitrospirota bacterium]MDH5586821.1 hypothetical protein [Nitrospirota bacterium]MDH5774228.1 hypothetical protein [Nitrospirota bacterium]